MSRNRTTEPASEPSFRDVVGAVRPLPSRPEPPRAPKPRPRAEESTETPNSAIAGLPLRWGAGS
jgi:hypothetical protein